MKRHIIVVDVAAVIGGAMSILNDFLASIDQNAYGDIEWTFILAADKSYNTPKVKKLVYQWIKKSWIHRLFWEFVYSPLLLRKLKPDLIISLQCLCANYRKCPQAVYEDQPIPFQINRRLSLFNPGEAFLAFYNMTVGRMIIRDAIRADLVICQTETMKRLVAEKTGRLPQDTIVANPTIKAVIPQITCRYDGCSFIYPANPIAYKNHEIIVEAVKLLVKQGLHPTVYITMDGTENHYAKRIAQMCKGLGEYITLTGYLPREEIMSRYLEHTLLFPSFIESHPMPLAEAQHAGCNILAADLDYAHELLNDYDSALFFDPNSAYNLAERMSEVMGRDFKPCSSKLLRNPDTWPAVVCECLKLIN